MTGLMPAMICGGLASICWSWAAAQGEAPPQHPGHEPSESQSTQQAPAAATVADDGSSEAAHIPPQPPQHPLGATTYRDMANMMQMDDTERFGKVLVDELEWRSTDAGAATAWFAQGWYGGDYNKLRLRTEGERVGGTSEDARAELFWDRIVSRWWNLQAGARHDFGEGPGRTWAALGVQGLAPYWFNVEATLYFGEEGRTAARLRTEYDILLTQRLIVRPEAEVNVYGKADPARQIGSGVSDLNLGVRMRYEFRREFAPYVGVSLRRLFGASADRARSSGTGASDVQLVAGLRLWF